MKIKYVQLESDAFLTDLDFIQFSPAERGLYCSLIFFLNSNDGKCEFDPPALSRLCNCQNEREFEILWEKISKKFQSRNGVIKHKRVTKELRKAKKFRQARRKAGLKGAQVTWQSHNRTNSTDNSTAMAKERKGNVIENESKDNNSNTNSNNLSFSSSNSVRSSARNDDDDAYIRIQKATMLFRQNIDAIIPPRSRSDRTCFDRVARWLQAGCVKKQFDIDIFDRALGYANEARAGQKPAAVFMALLKKELEYRHE